MFFRITKKNCFILHFQFFLIEEHCVTVRIDGTSFQFSLMPIMLHILDELHLSMSFHGPQRMTPNTFSFSTSTSGCSLSLSDVWARCPAHEALGTDQTPPSRYRSEVT